jgi:UDP-2,3-diacylglucosamine hydrolase
MASLFISDLHLHASRPDICRCFTGFLETLDKTQTLYILGDLFETWVGDDHPGSTYAAVKQALKRCTDAGTPVHLMHGNRDFLLGERFAGETGCTLLEDPSVIDLCGRRALLMHGDSLCTDDGEYQALRKQLRNPQWQQQALSLPLPERLEMADMAREHSSLSSRDKDSYLMDVNQGAVVQVMDEHRAELLIHGHTHRPGIHQLSGNGRPRQRVVLGDWYKQGSVLTVTDGQLELTTLPV